jgi:hypothetical protein
MRTSNPTSKVWFVMRAYRRRLIWDKIYQGMAHEKNKQNNDIITNSTT